MVRLGIRLKDGTHTELKLLSVEHFCEPIVSAAVDFDQYPPFNSLDIAFIGEYRNFKRGISNQLNGCGNKHYIKLWVWFVVF